RALIQAFLSRRGLAQRSPSRRLCDAVKARLLIRLAGNRIGEGGAKYIADALQRNTTLTQFDLGSKTLATRGCMRMCNGELTRLADNGIGEGGAKHIADALQRNTTLTQLDLGGKTLSKCEGMSE